MIVNKTNIILNNDRVRIESKINTYNGKKTFTLWAEVPIEYADFVNDDGTAFASPMVLPASKRNDELNINGNVSKKWHIGVNQIVDRAVGWKNGFNKIKILAENFKEEIKPSTNNVGAFFSGGVDSFCTLIKYRQNQSIPLTHLIFVHGYDIALNNIALFETVHPKLLAIARSQNLKLITIRTNVREVTDEILNWEMAHGGALAFVALLLRNGFTNIIIPGAGKSIFPLEPWGSVPDMDPLWSTEGLNIIHDHDNLHRFEKIQKFISQSPEALENVRVCWRNNGYNCGHCDKCLMTMADLRAAGVLENTKTFPNKLDLKLFEKLHVTPYSIMGYVIETNEYLKKTGKDAELQKALTKCLQYSENPTFTSRLINYIHDIDAKYNESRLFLFLQKKKRIFNEIIKNRMKQVKLK